MSSIPNIGPAPNIYLNGCTNTSFYYIQPVLYPFNASNKRAESSKEQDPVRSY